MKGVGSAAHVTSSAISYRIWNTPFSSKPEEEIQIRSVPSSFTGFWPGSSPLASAPEFTDFSVSSSSVNRRLLRAAVLRTSSGKGMPVSSRSPGWKLAKVRVRLPSSLKYRLVIMGISSRAVRVSGS